MSDDWKKLRKGHRESKGDALADRHGKKDEILVNRNGVMTWEKPKVVPDEPDYDIKIAGEGEAPREVLRITSGGEYKWAPGETPCTQRRKVFNNLEQLLAFTEGYFGEVRVLEGEPEEPGPPRQG